MNAPTDRLSSKQRAFLRGQAHGLKAMLHIGKDGITDAVVTSAEEVLSGRELLKAKVLDNSPETARSAADELAARIEGAHVVQVIGSTVVLYRADPDEPTLKLPR